MALWGLGPAGSNCAVAFLMLVYIQIAVAVSAFFRAQNIISGNTSRKVVHIAAGCLILWWPLFDPQHWTWMLNITAAVIYTLKLLYTGLYGTPGDQDVQAMSRSGSPRDLLWGPLQFTLLLCMYGTLGFMNPHSALGMGCLGWGDAFAAIIGVKCRRHSTYSAAGITKTFEGSAAMFVGSILGTLLFSQILFNRNVAIDRIVIICSFATVAEAVSPSQLDNILITLTVFLMDMLLPSLTGPH